MVLMQLKCMLPLVWDEYCELVGGVASMVQIFRTVLACYRMRGMLTGQTFPPQPMTPPSSSHAEALAAQLKKATS